MSGRLSGPEAGQTPRPLTRLTAALSRAVLAGAILVSGLHGPAAPARTSPDAATFEPGPCVQTPEPVPALENARCGFLVVPENRAAPTGKTIRLPVAILPAVSATPAPDPVVYMEGGPGGPAIPNAQTMVDAGINQNHGVIVMGERGSAYADPAFTCPEVDDFTTQSANLLYDAPATGRKQIAAYEACHDRLADQGIDLGAFNTTENAADFADLRVALGIAEWNVFGVSYGTDLALTYMREHPEGVRSVTIDSVVPPPRASLGLNWTNAGGGMRNVFRACKRQSSCDEAYPNLSKTFSEIVEQLEDEPLEGTVEPGIPGQPVPPGTEAIETTVDGGAFATLMFAFTEVAGPDISSIIAGVADGDEKTQREVLAAYAATKSAHAGVYSFGLQNGVVCSEWVPYEPRGGVIRTGRKEFPMFPRSVLAQAPQFAWQNGVCDVWPVPKAPAEQRDATTGTIPTLVISGGFDALTSAQVAKAAASQLENSTFTVIPGVGHFVVPKSPCAQSVMASFLATPLSPDTGCVAELEPPPFEIARS